jgi:SAM-dependent methyltransferase
VARERTEPEGHALYARPRYYDHAFRAHRRDIAHYVELALRARGPVLELGAGTGRITLPLLRAGVSVTAVDRSPAMLARARERADRLTSTERGRLELVEGDLCELRLRRKFALVLATFNLLMHMYTRRDVERALRRIHAHLTPRGRFACDVLMPDLGVLRRDSARFYRCRPIFDPSDGHRYAYAEQFAYDPSSQVQTVSMHFQRLDKPDVLRMTPLVLRFFFPQELLALLHYNGFEVLRHEGDFAGDPLAADSESQVIVARPTRLP